MKVIKNIHNNISLCLDSKGNEVIVFGKGIGFKKPPYDFPIEKVESTYYNVDSIYIEMISSISEDVIEISKKTIEYANSLLNGSVSNNVIFTIADHINFCIKRIKNNINVNLPVMTEVRYLYPNEIKIGEYAVRLIREKYNIKVPKDEAAAITLHILEYGDYDNNINKSITRELIEQCTEVIEQEMNINIKKDSFNYTRFLSHMYFLLERVKENEPLKSENNKMFEKLANEYPLVLGCVKKLEKVLSHTLTDEETMYLILHINRLISREI